MLHNVAPRRLIQQLPGLYQKLVRHQSEARPLLCRRSRSDSDTVLAESGAIVSTLPYYFRDNRGHSNQVVGS